MTHVAVISSDFEVSKVLPQIVLVAERYACRRDYREALTTLDPGVKLWRRKSGWMNKIQLVEWLEHLAVELRKLAGRQPILLLDAHRVHCAETVLRKAASLGIWICLVPASCTHVLQPLDTDVFAMYKCTLRQKLVEASSEGPNADLPFPAVMKCVSNTIAEVVLSRSWNRAFGKNGLGLDPVLRETLARSLPDEVRPEASAELPTLQQLQACFPKGSDIPIGSVFKALLDPKPREALDAGEVIPGTSRKRKGFPFMHHVEPWTRARLRARRSDASAAVGGSKPSVVASELVSTSVSSSSTEPCPKKMLPPRSVPTLSPSAKFPPVLGGAVPLEEGPRGCRWLA